MVLKTDVSKRVRRKINDGNDSKNGCRSRERLKSSGRDISSSLTLADALFMVGPYTYIVRQPEKMESIREIGCNADGRSVFQRKFRATLHKDDEEEEDIRKNETSQHEETPLWISPVLQQRQQKEETVWTELEKMPLDPASSPQPRPPLSTQLFEGEEYNNDIAKLELKQRLTCPSFLFPRRSQTICEQQCNTDPSTTSSKLLFELLRQMQRRRDVGNSLKTFTDQPKGSKGSDDMPIASQERGRQPGQQKNVLDCVLPSRENTKHGKGLVTTKEESLTASPYGMERISLDAFQCEERLWEGIKEDKERTFCWVENQGLVLDEDTLALQVFAEYLKKKTDRLERDNDELFWAAHHRPLQQQRPRQYNQSQGYPLSSRERSHEEIASGVRSLTNDHPYFVNTKATVNRHQQSTCSSKGFIDKGRVSHVSCSGKKKKMSRNVSAVAACHSDDYGEMNTNIMFSSSLKRRGWHTRRSNNHRVGDDTLSFYTGHSIKTEMNQETKGRSCERPMPISPSTPKRKTGSFESAHTLADQSAPRTPPLPSLPSLQEMRESNEGMKKKAPAIMWQELDTAAASTVAGGVSGASQLSEDLRPPSGECLSTFAPPSTRGLKDTSVLTRLHEYSTELEQAWERMLGVENGESKPGNSGSDVRVTAEGAERREDAFQTQKTAEVKRNTVNDRPAVLSPAPSIVTTSTSFVRPHQADEGVAVNNSSDKLGAFATSSEYVDPCRMDDTEHRSLYRSTTAKKDGTAVMKCGSIIARPNLFFSSIRSVPTLEDGQQSGGRGQCTLPVSAPFRSSRRISPMPDEIYPVTSHSTIEEKQGKVGPVVEESMYTNPPHPSSEGFNDGTITAFQQWMDTKKTGTVDICSFEANYNCSETSKRAMVCLERGGLETPFFYGGVISDSGPVERTLTKTCALSSVTDAPTLQLQSLETSFPLEQKNKLSLHHSLSTQLLDDDGRVSVYSCNTLTKKSGDAGKTGGIEGGMWANGSFKSNEDEVEVADGWRQRRRHYTPEGRKRFSVDTGNIKSAALTNIVEARTLLGGVERNAISPPVNRGSRIRTRTRSKGSTCTVEGIESIVTPGSSGKTTPHRKTNKIFVRVINAGNNNDNGGREQMRNRRGGMGGPHSRRFGLCQSNQ